MRWEARTGEEAHPPGGGDTNRVGPRAARNTVSRAAGELVGKLATLVLIAALGRELGEAGVGTYFIALAFVLIATMPIEVGIDRYFLRRLARERQRSPELYDVLALKLVLAVPVISLSFLLVNLIGYNDTTRTAVYVLTPGLLLDSAARTVHHASYAFERASIAGLGLAIRGVLAAALGIAALLAGYGVVTVAAAYTTAAGVGFAIAFVLFGLLAGLPSPRLRPTVWRGLMRNSLPFGVQDAFSVLLSRIDTIILSLLASATAVGRYGAAYRLLEATFVVSASINSAFAAMFTYLARDTQPSVATSTHGR